MIDNSPVQMVGAAASALRSTGAANLAAPFDLLPPPLPVIASAGAADEPAPLGQAALPPMPVGQFSVTTPNQSPSPGCLANPVSPAGQIAFVTQGSAPPSPTAQFSPAGQTATPKEMFTRCQQTASVKGLVAGNGNWSDQEEARSVGTRQDFKSTSAWRFQTKGQPHTIEIAHEAAVWNVELDGVEVAEKSQDQIRLIAGVFSKDKVIFKFPLSTPAGELQCSVKGTWNPNPFAKGGHTWTYTCKVNGMIVPQCWTRDTGEMDVDALEVS